MEKSLGQSHTTPLPREGQGGGVAESGSAGDGSLREKTAQGLIWGGFSNGLMQLLNAVIGLVLLNYLTPADYGKMAALLVFSNIAGCLQESGFTAALANKREAAHEDYNAVFWFNVLAGTLIYIVLFIAAPAIARFYHEPALLPLARFVFVGLWLSSLGISQQAWLFSHLQVKQVSLINLTALTVAGIAGIVMAMRGMAYWGLAVQSVLYTAVGTALRWWVSPWRPTLPAAQEEVKSERVKSERVKSERVKSERVKSEGVKSEKYKRSGLYMAKGKSYFSLFTPSLFTLLRPAWQMFGFSSKLLVNSLAFQLNNNAFGFLLNRFYPGGHVAGIYSTARKWDDMAIATIGGMVQGVAQPVLRESLTPAVAPPSAPEGATAPSRAANKGIEAPSGAVGGASVFRKLLRFTCFVSFPCLLGLALIAEDFIVLLVGEKWHESASLLSLLCIYGAFSPVVTLYSNLVIARGRSTINMTIGLVNCALVWGGIIVLHALGYALTAMVLFYVVLNIAWLFVWQACARRLIALSWWHALKDILPFFLFALGVMAAAYAATFTLPISWLRLALRILIAVVLYLGSLWFARAQILRESIDYILKKHI